MKNKYSGYAEPYRQLMAAIIRRAVLDLEARKPCSPKICDEEENVHACFPGAVDFLLGDWCADLLEGLNISRDSVCRLVYDHRNTIPGDVILSDLDDRFTRFDFK